MWLIAALIVIAALLLVAELVLIPGISIAGVGAVLAYGAAIWVAWARYGATGGLIVLGVVLLISLIAVVVALRSRTWERLSLKDNIDGVSQQLPQQDNVAVGDRGVAISRLAPMGKVAIGSRTYEAKSLDTYIDENSQVEVTDFDNFNIVVKKINPNT